jgi:hypothetical protein
VYVPTLRDVVGLCTSTTTLESAGTLPTQVKISLAETLQDHGDDRTVQIRSGPDGSVSVSTTLVAAVAPELVTSAEKPITDPAATGVATGETLNANPPPLAEAGTVKKTRAPSAAAAATTVRTPQSLSEHPRKNIPSPRSHSLALPAALC